MKIAVFFTAVILVTCTATNSCPKEGDCPDDCGMVGKWKNELDSTLVVKSCQNGQIDGLYNTAVGNASNNYVLTGRYTLSGPDGNVAELGWVVSYNNKVHGNSNSVASWNGIYYPKEGILYTQWILTRYAKREDLWKSSMINHDEFMRG